MNGIDCGLMVGQYGIMRIGKMDSIRIVNYFCSLAPDINELVLVDGIRDGNDLIIDYKIGLEYLNGKCGSGSSGRISHST